ncbi:YbaB/EbfC family nucleoid-associated protein [Crossiella sp. CA-258035]|uniref:YbaB/EbfC family nucleoid-associated protein n=1 Tax=Crossiella sp. CA-258035 TaxID=2981138 RepID=UPI0024BC1B89|nr:YbaB/EbfC family nucleoid-associated protein [Crossiella sp. CA-258035]WHT20154.1 YbaB/EbfC family nucleoid-associated protein [Crossiella sp. CA-258035]
MEEIDLGGFSAVERELEQTRQRLAAARAEAAGHRHRAAAAAPDGSVTAVVNGVGELLELDVDDRALRTAHPRRLGPVIVTAIGEARALAAAQNQAALAELLPAFEG